MDSEPLGNIFKRLFGRENGVTLKIEKRKLHKPISLDKSIDNLLAGSPQKKLRPTNEDREWLEAPPRGKEI